MVVELPLLRVAAGGMVEKGTDEWRSESRYDGKKERAREDIVALEEV